MNCLICGEDINPNDTKTVVNKPQERGLLTIITAAEKRQDQFSDRILINKNAILSGNLNFKFHKECRQTYTSENNIILRQNQYEEDELPATSIRSSNRDGHFDIRRMCLVCEKTGRKKRENLTSIQTGTGEATRAKILEAAEARKDNEMISKLVNYTDLFAYDAKYHKSCYSHYISKRNITARINSTRNKVESNSHGAFLEIVNYVRDHIIKNHETIALSSLSKKYNDILLNCGKPATKSSKLKTKLLEEFGKQIIFISKPGKADIISAADADTSKYLRQHLELGNSSESESELLNFQTNGELSDIQILHRAAGIIRRSMSEHQPPNKTFPSPDGINISEFVNQVPNTLISFVTLLMEKEAFDNLNAEFMPTVKSATLSNIIMSCYAQEFSKTNFHIGLGLYVYQTVRSKQIIDTLYNLGLSCSYNDIRCLTTTLAKQKLNGENGIIPYGIEKVDKEKQNFIHGSIDNFDLNEETLDGKLSTHSMALVVFQETSEILSRLEDFPKESKYSLNNEPTNMPFQKIVKYQKPVKRPEPSKLLHEMKFSSQKYEDSKKLNFVWKILRYFNNKKGAALGWTDFNNILSHNTIDVSNIGYLPFLNAPPTEFDTIYTAMLRLVQLAEHLNQEHIIVTADLAIYSKAQEILWNKPTALSGKITLQLGGMHLTMALLASIGFIFRDGGLHSLLVETGVYAENSAKLMLEGKQYSRAIRALTLSADALSRLLFECATEWFEEKYGKCLITDKLRATVDIILKELCDSKMSADNFNQLLTDLKPFEEAIEDFTNTGVSFSATFNYWLSFLEAVDLLHNMLRAERNGDFESHLCSVYEALPYLTAAGRHLYAKWVPIYLKDMEELKSNIPEMYQYLLRGNFVVKKTKEKKFNCVASDMALEQSINRDCKSSAGVVGFTQKPSALLRWIMTRHILGNYSQHFKEVSTENNKTRYRSEGSTLRDRNEDDVQKIINTIKNDWCNPFNLNEVPTDLVNICTGRVATLEIQQSLIKLLDTSTIKIQGFINNTIINGDDSFWKAFKKDKILTFAETKKKTPGTKSKKCIGSEVMFRRIVTSARFQNIDLTNVLSYELTHVPVSIFNDDETIRKTTKADLAKKLESYSAESLSSIINVNSVLIDGMVVVQELNEKTFSTFNELASVFLNVILSIGRKGRASRIGIVFDNYDSRTVKSIERSRRGDSKIYNTYEVIGTRKIIKYRDFLKLSDNKRSLLKFLTRFLLKNSPEKLNQDETLIVSGGFENFEMCYSITKENGVTELAELRCNHDEADTRLILHCIYESKIQTNKSILIRSTDTDVLVLLLFYYNTNSNLKKTSLFIELGIGTGRRVIAIHHIAQKLNEINNYICNCLPSLHALTGCDVTNAFFKIGKKTAFEVLVKNAEDVADLSALDSVDINQAIKIATNFVLLLYKNKKNNIKTLNELRLYLTTNSNKAASELPPTDDTFKQHVLRSIYQLKIWCSSHVNIMKGEDPSNYGWRRSDENWEPVLSTQAPIPEDIRNVLLMYCNDKNCKTNKCICVKEGLKCCDGCNCKQCNNIAVAEVISDSDSDSEL